jgi:hypothetical protein
MARKRRIARRASAVLGAAALTAGVLPVTAGAVKSDGTTVAAACWMQPGSVTSGGDNRGMRITTGSPVTVTPGPTYPDIYPAGQVSVSTSIELLADSGAYGSVGGWVVMGSSLYGSNYQIDANDNVLNLQVTKVGGGWGGFKVVDTSYYNPPSGTGPNFRANQYGLSGDGVLYRWKAQGGKWWTGKESYPGFAAVKTMALISRTFTYDTFLANTRGGALYTIRIPTSSPMKPIVKQVRTSTWQSFDWLLAQKCGTQSTLLLGIDKETQSGYLYAVGHANGAATVIQGLGKVPTTFPDPVYFRRKTEPGSDDLYGE